MDALRDICTQHRDFAGTGDRSGGVHSEISALQGQFLDAIRLYAVEIAGTPIAYASGFPYFFADPSGTGESTPDQITRDNRYQVAAKDPGGYMHNPRYMLQRLNDTLPDLAGVTGLDVPHISRP
ncbi:hypothetical protein [Roseinatronobacter sp. NSM]|uniref:hypothetical protein n=1 Tax=Roseinatronobacter sp. NSM TaxID=3457785 RepID=UPI004035915F